MSPEAEASPRGGATGGRRFHPLPSSIPAARSWAREVASGLPAETEAALELVVAEFVTNAVRHAGTTFELRISTVPSVRVEVEDLSPELPRAHSGHPLGGRGLQIVGRLARWGVKAGSQSKVVWAELRASNQSEGGDPATTPSG